MPVHDLSYAFVVGCMRSGTSWVHQLLIVSAFPTAKIVEVLRDGRDVCVSMQQRSKMEAWAPADRRAQIET